MEFYSATKKIEILSFTSEWMELEDIILREVSQLEGQKSSSPSHTDYRPKTNAII
jgi:hypothetical protein